MAENPLDRLLALMRAHFAKAANGAAAAESARVLAALPDPGAPLAAELTASAHPLLAEVPEAARAAGADWAAALPPLAARLPWRYSYAPRPDLPNLGNRMAWAELVGPAAPIRSDAVGFGLTFITRGTFYPVHRHPAVELYAVVAGESEWTLEGETLLRRPGDFILHPSGAPHAMRALETPLLAIYSWSGDIVSPTAYA